MASLNLIFIGLSLSSSWGNGHATTYRALLKALRARGHAIQFYEFDAPWYREHRDLPRPEYADLRLYREFDDVKDELEAGLLDADAVILGSYTQQGTAIAQWLFQEASGTVPILFYDIDTPVTLRKLSEGDFEYIEPEAIPEFAAYLSFSGGRALAELEKTYGARQAIAFHCSADPDLYFPEPRKKNCSLGYLGTYSTDRYEPMKRLLLDVAERLPQERFEVVGPQYPAGLVWPRNVGRQEHLPPAEHRAFYNRQRFTLNITRADMVALGHSPSVRLFEAAACGVPVISDCWAGIEDYFEPGSEILLVRDTDEVARILRDYSDEDCRRVGERARARFLAEHSPDRRAAQFESIVASIRQSASAGWTIRR